jgi:hypothetical protein
MDLLGYTHPKSLEFISSLAKQAFTNMVLKICLHTKKNLVQVN